MKLQKDGTVLLDNVDIKRLCKPGEMANTCIWVLVGLKGFECSYYNRPKGLVSRWRQGLTNAKRNGCDEIKELGLEVRYVEAETLEDIMKGVDA